jgi:hypothetical protein
MDKEDTMRRYSICFIIVVSIVVFLAACATSNLPKGSNKIASYSGTFAGTQTSGNGMLDLFELPDGSKKFKGSFGGLSTDTVLFFEGKVTGKQLAGKFDNATGTVSGTISDSDQNISGTYDLENLNRNGTWKFTKK